jgi:MFS family permease
MRSASTPSWLRLAGLTLLALGLGMATNTVDPALLSAKVNELAPDRRNTALGFTTAAGLLVATATQPVIGVLSDRTASAWGRRVPYIVVGTLIAIASLFSLALAPSIALLVVGFLAYELGSNTAQAPWQALLPDQVPASLRGAASGIKTVFEILAFVLGRRISSYLVAEGSLVTSIAVASAVFLGAMLITAIAAREPREAASQNEPTNATGSSPEPSGGNLWPEGFGWWFLNRGLFWGATIALSNFVLFYLVDVIGMTFAEGARFFGDLSLVLGLSLLAITLPAGRLSDRIGRRPLILGACIVAVVGNAVLLFARTRPALTVGGGILGLAVGIYLSANWALATDIVPRFKAARYLGVANIATAGGSFAARFAGGALIDPINRLAGNDSTGYFTLYSLTLVAFVIAALAVLRLPKTAFGPS